MLFREIDGFRFGLVEDEFQFFADGTVLGESVELIVGDDDV